MKLPCHNIFGIRMALNMELFDPSLCDRNWSIEYYKTKQRIFIPDNNGEEPSSDVSVVSFSAPQKKTLFQVIFFC